MSEKNPQQLKLPFALWKRKVVQLLIYNNGRLKIVTRTIGEDIKLWGFTPQKPLKGIYESNPKVLDQWLEVTYPEFHSRPKAQSASIYWGDETGLKNCCQNSIGYSPLGKTNVVSVNTKRFSDNMISAINIRGTVRFMMYEQTMNAKVLIKFMKRLVRIQGEKCFSYLIICEFIMRSMLKLGWSINIDKIGVYYPPTYSPDLNPVEYLNNYLKTGIRTSSSSQSKEDSKGKVQSHMQMLQQKLKKVTN